MIQITSIIKSPLQPDQTQQWDVHYADTDYPESGQRCFPLEFPLDLTAEQAEQRARTIAEKALQINAN